MGADKAQEPVADRLAALLDGPEPASRERAIAAMAAAAPASPLPPRALATMTEIVSCLARLGAAAFGDGAHRGGARAQGKAPRRRMTGKEPIT